MIRSALLPFLPILAAGALAAEDAPPAATPAPAATTPAGDANASASAAAAPPAAPSKPVGQVLSGMVSVSAGYDSNVILAPSNNPTPTGKSSAMIGADASATLDLIDHGDQGLWQDWGGGERMHLTVDGMIRDYPDQSQFQLIRGGVHLVGSERESWGDPGFVVGYNHYDLDRKDAADAANGDLFASHVGKDYRNVDVAILGAEWLRYIQEPDQTGGYGTLGWNHWLLLGDAADVHRRVEAGLSIDGEKARTSGQTFYGVQPDLGLHWRLGSGERLGTYDGALIATYEFRRYGSTNGQAEHQGIADVQATADAWLCPNASAGIYFIWTHRTSNFTFDRYDREQVGGRITATW
jgi:hypothetical protein